MAAEEAAWRRVRDPDLREELRVLTAMWDAERRCALLHACADLVDAGVPPSLAWVIALGEMLP